MSIRNLSAGTSTPAREHSIQARSAIMGTSRIENCGRECLLPMVQEKPCVAYAENELQREQLFDSRLIDLTIFIT
jgi:hypothetical protein